MRTFDVFSVILEIAVLIMGILMATVRKKKYGWGIAFTFGIYVLYDLIRFSDVNMSRSFMSVLFFAASASMLWAAVAIYSKR